VIVRNLIFVSFLADQKPHRAASTAWVAASDSKNEAARVRSVFDFIE
jgi:hypothetical protein